MGLLPWPDIWRTLNDRLPSDSVPLVIEGLDESEDPDAAAATAIAFMADLPEARLVRLASGVSR
jgi:hypothetical protein